ncbi:MULTISPECIES: alpha/beta hydrolase [Streptomyces]|uniref:Alpha/beta fold hydrolase n=1 Tax=Streptomyces griseiscabiei TaxID=2993540 RepID=A0ABU4LH27_9ACTN|nr:MULTISPECIES: alpha/beta hydrolase [Streptomyces]MBZ3907946.1 alpha/beta hydrolase [Streptomyces griseiscabiei]MDX2915095.1 alpha/beta fold hydrolase [Streptomyces griseiscabiei]
MAEPPEIRSITLDAAGVPLSALLAEPAGPPRALVVAIHGAGMSAGYFDSRSSPGLSLLALGARLGYAVLAVDRPGYGASAPYLPEGQTLDQQAATLHAALGDFAVTSCTGAEVFLVAHSNGGKLALVTAAGWPAAHPPGEAACRLVGLDISGLGSTLAVDAHRLPGPEGHGDWRRHWGSLRFYPPDAFRLSRALVSPVPGLEASEGPLWPLLYPGIAARVTVPVRFTFAEQEQWWRCDAEALAALTAPLAAARVTVDHQPDAGHNISLGWAARTYHLRALGFLEECLLARDAAPARGPSAGRPVPAARGRAAHVA